MPKPVAVDAGPIVALFDRTDHDHPQALAFFNAWKGDGFVTTAVVAEVSHLLSFHPQAPLDFLRWLQQGALSVEDLGDDLDRVIQLIIKYSDVPMDFGDATIVAACERLRIRQVATLDSDFAVYRMHGRQTFDNIFPT